jgi:hypothetical protein
MSADLRSRPLVLVVGSDASNRTNVARKLISDGSAVILCPGPPGCPLLRGSPCVLVEGAEVAVIMPGASRAPEVLSGLALCSEAARRVIHAGGCDAGRATRVDPDAVAHEVSEALTGRLN